MLCAAPAAMTKRSVPANKPSNSTRFLPNTLWWQGLSYAGIRDFSRSIDSLAKGVGMSDAPLFRALLGHVYGPG
jgi:hypothetical protein